MKELTALLFLLVMAFMSISQEKMDYFLPDDVTYDKNIPTPEQFYGQQTGEWHLTHDQILSYAKEITRISNRAILQEYARTWENRPLVQLIFTSEQNQKNLDKLKELHIKYANPDENIDKSEVPLVVNPSIVISTFPFKSDNVKPTFSTELILRIFQK